MTVKELITALQLLIQDKEISYPHCPSCYEPIPIESIRSAESLELPENIKYDGYILIDTKI